MKNKIQNGKIYLQTIHVTKDPTRIYQISKLNIKKKKFTKKLDKEYKKRFH